MKVAILVPRRAGNPQRDRLWRWCRARWGRLHPTWPICEGHHNHGPFSAAAARNEAARLAGAWDVAVIADADVFIEPELITAAVERAAETGHPVWPFEAWQGLTRAASERVLVGAAPPDLASVEEVVPDSWAGAFAVPRAAWEALGGYDERFRGWGWEDVAFAHAAHALVGGERLAGSAWHLWHPRSPERNPKDPGYRANRALGERYLAALRSGSREPIETLLAEARAVRTGVTAIALTNGRREYCEQAIDSFEANVSGNVIRRRIFDDSGRPAHRAWLRARFPAWRVIGYRGNVGYTRAMAAIWRYIAARPGGYGFLLEEDFTFNGPVELSAMAAILDADPNLVQVSLLRQAWFAPEVAVGGIIQRDPAAYTPRRLNGYAWLEHRKFWTGNPSLFRRSLCETPWPNAHGSERVYGERLFADPALHGAILGHGEQLVTHIGAQRTGRGY